MQTKYINNTSLTHHKGSKVPLVYLRVSSKVLRHQTECFFTQTVKHYTGQTGRHLVCLWLLIKPGDPNHNKHAKYSHLTGLEVMKLIQHTQTIMIF